MKCARHSVESIKLMAEAACIVEPSIEAASFISQDTAFRLKQIISRANKFMKHANRQRLTCADINKALKWSDCQPVFGHQCNPNQRLRYSYSAEARVFMYENDIVDLDAKHKQQPKIELNDQILCETLPRLMIEEAESI